MNSIVFAVVPSTVEPASLPLLGLGLVTLTMGVINDALCESQTGLPPAIRGLSAERNNFALRESFSKGLGPGGRYELQDSYFLLEGSVSEDPGPTLSRRPG